jgi:hypothetical protein
MPYIPVPMPPKLENLSSEDLRSRLEHLVKKFLFGLNIEASPEELQIIRDEIKEIMELLYKKEGRPANPN